MEQLPEIANYFIWAWADVPGQRKVRWARTSTMEEIEALIAKWREELPELQYDLYTCSLTESTCREL